LELQLIGRAEIGDGRRRCRIAKLARMRRTLLPYYHYTSAMWLMETD
jgi:hypothetical protein